MGDGKRLLDGLSEAGVGGFRNILVHDYLRIDLERVAENLARAPGDFSRFSEAIDRWLERIGQ